jgi:hypothetical protein
MAFAEVVVRNFEGGRDFIKRLRDRRCGKSFNEVMDEADDHGDDGTIGAAISIISRGLRTCWSRRKAAGSIAPRRCAG